MVSVNANGSQDGNTAILAGASHSGLYPEAKVISSLHSMCGDCKTELQSL